MKTVQLKLKTLLLLLVVCLTLTSCGNGKEGDSKNPDADSNQKQIDNPPLINEDSDATSPNPSEGNNSRIATEDAEKTSPSLPEGNTAPIALDCDYFNKNPNTVLKDNPEAPVDYIITCMTRIDGKLSIAPGVVIAFDQDAGMEFKDKSSFEMVGTAEKPIILTGKEKTKGFWRGIHTESSSSNNKMSYVTVDYAGGNPSRGSLKTALGIYRETSNLTLDHCTFSNSKYNGMVVNDDVGKDVHNIIMENCTFTKNNIPVQTNITRLRMFNGSNSFSGNEKDYIYLDRETLQGDATWAKLDVPYFLQDNFRYVDGVLTVEPGTEIIMTAQSWMHVSNKSSLIMVGTEEAPITIRGEHDVPGFWNQLTIDSSSPLNEIAHVNFKNAGPTTDTPNGAVRLKRSKYLNIHDVTFTDCFEYGLSIQSASSSHLEHANLTLNNTSKLFSNWKGEAVANPNSL